MRLGDPQYVPLGVTVIGDFQLHIGLNDGRVRLGCLAKEIAFVSCWVLSRY